LAGGIGNINRVTLSSILPPVVRIVPMPRIKPGALVPTAFAAVSSTVPLLP
jgi:pyruvoyl-dependent arginine decarboxylase (PvlArgDC)